jgi:FtsZ-binding cell division protein ZapB
MLSLLAVPLARGQETTAAASLPEIVENYKILKGQVDDLRDANTALQHQVADLQSKIDALTAQQGKPSGDYASQDDVKALKAAIEDEDKKRLADNEEVLKELKLIAKATKTAGISAMPAHPAGGDTGAGRLSPAPATAPVPDGPGFTYIVKSDDTPNKIAKKLFEEKGIKITGEEIMAANPKVKDPTKLWIGREAVHSRAKGGGGHGKQMTAAES